MLSGEVVGVIFRLSWFLLVSGLIHVIKSYPFGAGLSACKTLIPGHAKEPQPMDTLPFMIEPEADYFTPGKVFKVRIKTISGKFKNRKIGGFFLQAREPETTDPVGRWEINSDESIKFGMKGQNCTYPFDSITHSDSKPKNADLVLHFIPTSNTPDQIQFMGTIARDYGTFWANVKSTIVTKRVLSEAEMLRETATTPKGQGGHVDMETIPTTTTHLPPKRINHVTKHMPSEHHTTTHRIPQHRQTHHFRRTTTTTTELPKYKVDPEKYQEIASLLNKNELENGKSRAGQKDDEADRVQNDGSTNPDSQSSKVARRNAAGAQQHDRRVWAFIITQLTLFISCWCLCLV